MGFTTTELQKLHAGDEKYLLYISSFSGFTWDLFDFYLGIDNGFNYRLDFGYFDPKMESSKKAKFYCEGMLPKTIKEVLQGLQLKNFSDIYAYSSPDAHQYASEDIGYYSYKIKNGNEFVDTTLYYPNPSHIERFENNTGKQFYNLHCKIVEWIESLYRFIKEQHYKV